jgi:hypothetical protein
MQNRLRRAALCAAVGLLTWGAGQAFAQGINLSFEADQSAGIPANTFAGAANQAGVWNRVFASSPIPLNDITGAASGVILTRPGPLFHNAFNSPSTSGDYQSLLDDYWALNMGAKMIFDNVDPGWYDVVVYAINPSNFASRTQTTIAGGWPLPIQEAGGVMPFNNFFQGITHTKHRLEVSASGQLVVDVNPNALGGAINGVQIKPAQPCPEVKIVAPDNFACICDEVDVKGDVTIDPPGNVAFWFLQYREINDSNWSFINFGFNTGASLPLGTFNASSLTQGYYFLKLTAFSGDGCFDEDTQIVFVDKQFDNLQVTSPAPGSVVGGTACIGGTINDQCLDRYTVRYAPLPAGAPYTDVNALMPSYFANIYNAVTFATWNTQSPAVADGPYRIEVAARDVCGHTAVQTIDVIVDNTAPDGKISSPENCSYVDCDLVEVIGTACDANLQSWILDYTGGGQNGWVTIATGNSCVEGDLLAIWDTSGLQSCAYTLRLRVYDQAIVNCTSAFSNSAEFQVSVNVGLAADANGDNVVNFDDLTAVLANFGTTCP